MIPNIRHLNERAAALGLELRSSPEDSLHFDLYYGEQPVLLEKFYPDVEMWISGAEFEHARHTVSVHQSSLSELEALLQEVAGLKVELAELRSRLDDTPLAGYQARLRRGDPW
jgi:hypothetical protein